MRELKVFIKQRQVQQNSKTNKKYQGWVTKLIGKEILLTEHKERNYMRQQREG